MSTILISNIMNWINAPESTEDLFGFVYVIVNKTTKKWYIGQKQFHKVVKMKPLKGRVNKRHVKKPSNWVEYTGSSNCLNSDIERGDEISKAILCICGSKWELNYVETWLQFVSGALISEESYNGIINLRISKMPDSLNMNELNDKIKKINLDDWL